MQTIRDLRHGGQNERESGAFLLGKQDADSLRVVDYVCFDMLDPRAYQHGAIAFHDSGYAALWDYCEQKRLRVLADVHTHPGADVRQSSIDRRHPTMPLIGHTAMIVPHFANTPWWSLKAVGVYEYLGNYEWRTHRPDKPARRVKLSIW